MNKRQLNLKTQLTLWSKECHCQEGTYGCVSWMVATQNCICCMYTHTHTHTHTHTFYSSVKYIRNRTMFNEKSVSNRCLKQTVMAIFMKRLSKSLDNKSQQPSRDAFFHSSVSLLLGAVYIVYLTVLWDNEFHRDTHKEKLQRDPKKSSERQESSGRQKKKLKKENYIFSLQGGRDSGIEDPHQTVCFL